MKKIMIVEDEVSISEELKELLDNNGYCSQILKDFKNSLQEIMDFNPNLVLLDINIPYLNGEQLLKDLRKFSDVPIIMLTSRVSEVDQVLSMSYGADDYITKPYNPTLLLLRIAAILKRALKSSATLYYKNLEIQAYRNTLRNGDKEVELTKNEMIIFNCLMDSQGKIVSRDDIMTALWNSSEYINDNALTVNISRLRGKLTELGYDEVIETKKGQGYILI